MFVGRRALLARRRAVEIARELDDAALLARALTACGYIAGTHYDPDAAAVYYAEALDLARVLDDRWSTEPDSGLAVQHGDKRG